MRKVMLWISLFLSTLSFVLIIENSFLFLSTSINNTNFDQKSTKNPPNLSSNPLQESAYFFSENTLLSLKNFTNSTNLKISENPKNTKKLAKYTASSTPVEPIFDRMDITLDSIDDSAQFFPDKSTTFPTSVSVIYNNLTYDFGFATIHGHGNSTWGEPKKPITIKFPSKINLLGLKKSKTWILLANHLDPTHLRNAVSYHLAENLLFTPSYSGKYIELYINGAYQGLYYLVPKINSTTVDLHSSHGLITEIDNLHEIDSTDIIRTSSTGDTFIFTDALDDSPENANSLMDSFMTSWDSLLAAIEEKDYKKVKKLIDIDSFAKYFLLSEFTANHDAYQTSFHFTKDGSKDKIHAGPAWDYDITYGSLCSIPDFTDPAAILPYKNEYFSKIMYSLLEFPEFLDRIYQIYHSTLALARTDTLDFLISTYHTIYDPAVKNNTFWLLGDDYYSEVMTLNNWISARFDTFSDLFSSKDHFKSTILSRLIELFPEDFTEFPESQ